MAAADNSSVGTIVSDNASADNVFAPSLCGEGESNQEETEYVVVDDINSVSSAEGDDQQAGEGNVCESDPEAPAVRGSARVDEETPPPPTLGQDNGVTSAPRQDNETSSSREKAQTRNLEDTVGEYKGYSQNNDSEDRDSDNENQSSNYSSSSGSSAANVALPSVSQCDATGETPEPDPGSQSIACEANVLSTTQQAVEEDNVVVPVAISENHSALAIASAVSETPATDVAGTIETGATDVVGSMETGSPEVSKTMSMETLSDSGMVATVSNSCETPTTETQSDSNIVNADNDKTAPPLDETEAMDTTSNEAPVPGVSSDEDGENSAVVTGAMSDLGEQENPSQATSLTVSEETNQPDTHPEQETTTSQAMVTDSKKSDSQGVDNALESTNSDDNITSHSQPESDSVARTESESADVSSPASVSENGVEVRVPLSRHAANKRAKQNAMNRILAAKQAWRNREREEVESAESKQSTESSMQADRTNGSIDTDLLSSSNTRDGQLDTGENMQKECGSEAIAETRSDPNHSEVSENESSAPANLKNRPIATLRKRRGVTRPTDRQTRKRRKQNQEPDRASQSNESYTCEKTKESTLEMAMSTTSGKWITVTLGTPVRNEERVSLNTADTEGSNKFANGKSPVQRQQEALDNHDMDDLDPIMYLVRSAFPKELPPEIEKIVHVFRLFDDGKSVDFVYREVEGTKRDVVRKWRGKYTLAKKKLKREQTVDKAEKKRTDKGKTHKIAPGREDTSSVMSTEASVAPVVHESCKVIATPRGGMRLRGKGRGTQVSDIVTEPPSRVNTWKRRLPNENDSTQGSGKKPREEGTSASPHSAADVQNGRWAANTSGKELLDSQDMTSKTFHAQGRKTNNPKPVTRSTRSNARLQSSLPSRASTEVSNGLSSQIKAASNDDEHSGESVSKRDQALVLLKDGHSVKQVAEKVGFRASTVKSLSNLLKTESVSKTERMKVRYCHAEPRIHLKNCQPTGTRASIKSASSASRCPRHVRGLFAKTPCTIVGTTNCADASWDGILLITDKLSSLTGSLAFLKKPLEELKEVDAAVEKDVVVAPLGGNAAKRVVFAPTGPLNRDYDDVRRFGDAAGKGVKRGLKAGCKSLLLVVPGNKTFHEARLVAALGALHSLYVPLEVREAAVERASKAEKLGIWAEDEEQTTRLCKLVEAMESGRLVARDIGGSDPERMAPVKVEEYVKELFKGSSVNISVISDPDVLDKEYPLHAAVDRCARRVDRHRGRIIEMEYKGEGNPDTTLLLVGKGVTYDTGGADIKHGGSMKGMHRDKCGAAAVAGFFQILALLQPKNIKVIGVLTLVRNSVGADSYVADEIITSRAGVRVRIGNTDAEGRMAMADPLCKMKDLALTEVNPHLYTIATLTGHAIRAMGPNYSIVLDNGPARKTKHAQELQTAGEDFGDPFEISSIRREDFEFHSGPSEYEDILQSNNAPSTMTARGHQSPAAFLIMVSGLDKHGVDSDKPLQYSHLDIAGSSGPFPGIPTGAPIVALAAKHLLSRI